MFVFFSSISKPRSPSWPMIRWDIFDFFSATAERNSTKLDRKQDLNVPYHICTFQADRISISSPWSLIEWESFWLLFCNRWKEFNETWHIARSQRPLISLCFRADQTARMAADKLKPFSTSSLQPMKGIQRNLTGNKISTSPTTFDIFCLSIRKQRWPPWSLIDWDNFDFISATAERNSTKLDKKQSQKGIQRNLTGSKFFTSCTIFVFFWPIGKTRWPPGLWLAETFSTSSLQPLKEIQRNLTGSKISMSSFNFFQVDRKIKITILASDLLRHFLLLCNRWK